MYTTLTLLFTFLNPATPGSPHWRTDYYTALNQVTEQGKPLAVFVGRGKEGWNQICSDGDLGKEAKHLLAENYVCVYVDSKRPDGKRLAEDFDISDGLGLVISDHTGRLQAFRHAGELAERDLLRHLKRYADPERVVRTTETASVERSSNYYPAEPPAFHYVQPQMFVPSFSGGGRSC